MKKLLFVATFFLFCSFHSDAGLPPTTVQGRSDSAATTKFNFQVPYNQYTNLGGIKSYLDTGNRNLLLNSSFEHTTFSTSWTSANNTNTVETTIIGDGKQSSHMAMSSQTGTMTQDVTPTIQLNNVNMEATCRVKTSMTTAQVCARTAATNGSCTSVPATNDWVTVTSNFVGPSNGTSVGVQIGLTGSGTGDVYVDDCYVGPARNISNISQAVFIGSAYHPATASCKWSRTNTALGSFGVDADCPAVTVDTNPGPGTLGSPATKVPAVTLTNAPPGTYMIVATGPMSGATATSRYDLALSDGTTTRGNQQFRWDSTGGDPEPAFNLAAYFTYTDTGTRTFEIYGADSGGNSVTVDLQNTNSRITFFVYKFPTTSSVATAFDQSPFIWFGYHANDCAWSRTNTGYGDFTDDASCTSTFSGGQTVNINAGTISAYGSTRPGFTFTPKIVGVFKACVYSNFDGQGSTLQTVRLTIDGSTAIGESQISDAVRHPFAHCGVFSTSTLTAVSVRLEGKASSGAVSLDVNSAAANAAYWTLEQLSPQINMPTIVNGVANTSSGGVKTMTAFVTNSGTPTVSRQDGSWISSLTDNSAGNTTVNISAGCTAAVNCTCSTSSTNATDTCKFDSTTAASTTAVRVLTARETAGVSAAADVDFTIDCTCAK
jgi:hypothetical protein